MCFFNHPLHVFIFFFLYLFCSDDELQPPPVVISEDVDVLAEEVLVQNEVLPDPAEPVLPADAGIEEKREVCN